MFSKAILPNEVISIPMQKKNDRLSIVVYVETATIEIDMFCVGLDEYGVGVKDFCSVPDTAASNQHVEWKLAGSKDPQGFRTLSIQLFEMPEEVKKMVLVLGAKDPASENALLQQWKQGSVKIRCGVQTWDWLFKADHFQKKASTLIALSLERQRYSWMFKIKNELLEQPADMKVKQWMEAPQFKELGKELPDSALPFPLQAISFDIPEILKQAQEQAKKAGELFRLADYTSRYAIVIDPAVLQSFSEVPALQQALRPFLIQLFALALANYQPSSTDGLEVFVAGQKCKRLGFYKPADLEKLLSELIEARVEVPLRYYGPMIEQVRAYLYPANQGKQSHNRCEEEVPVHIIAIIKQDAEDVAMAHWQLRWASNEPLFWNFMAITDQFVSLKTSASWKSQGGIGRTFKFLSSLEEITGCAVKNTGFLTLKQLGIADSDSFYASFLENIALWLQEASSLNMIRKRI